jgi:hypothetical protein
MRRVPRNPGGHGFFGVLLLLLLSLPHAAAAPPRPASHPRRVLVLLADPVMVSTHSRLLETLRRGGGEAEAEASHVEVLAAGARGVRLRELGHWRYDALVLLGSQLAGEVQVSLESRERGV